MSLIRRYVEQRDASSARIPSNSELVPPAYSGVRVTELRAIQQMTVWSCVTLISDSIMALPIGLFRKTADIRQPLPDPSLLTKPHPEQEWPEWISRLIVSILIRGNSYGLIIGRDRLGIPTDILPLHPDEVIPRRNKLTGRIEYDMRTANGTETIDRIDMLHIRGPSLPGAWNITGLSPIELARQGIGLALAMEEFGARLFGDGANPSGVLETDQNLQQPAIDRLEGNWRKAHGNRHRYPAVLTGGLKWKPMTITPEEGQFLESRRFSRGEIAGFYRVPPHMIGDVERSTSWGSGIEEQALGYVTYTIGPWLTRFEAALTGIYPRGQYVKFNVAGLLRGRLQDRYSAYTLGRQGGWLNIDDIRRLEEMPPLPDDKGSDYLQPLNYAPIPPGGAASPSLPVDVPA